MAGFRPDFLKWIARNAPTVSGRLFGVPNKTDPTGIEGVGEIVGPALQDPWPMFRTLCPTAESDGFWLMMDKKERRPYWRIFQPLSMSSYAARMLESYMAGSGAITVYNEPDRTQIIFDPGAVDQVLIDQLLYDRVMGPPPYFIRFNLHASCLWIAENRDDLERQLSELMGFKEVQVLPTGLRVTEFDPVPTAEMPMYRDIVENPLNWKHQAIIFRRETDMLRYEHVGEEAPVVAMLGDEWAKTIVGTPIDDGFEDRSYDKRTSVAYRRVLETGKPHVSQVSGPILTDAGPSYQNYYRIIAPIPQQPDQVLSVARLAGMAAPFFPSHSARECA